MNCVNSRVTRWAMFRTAEPPTRAAIQSIPNTPVGRQIAPKKARHLSLKVTAVPLAQTRVFRQRLKIPTQRGFWADPPRLSPRPNWLEIWCQIGVKDRRFGRFCRLIRLVTTYPSTLTFSGFPWHGSRVRIPSGPPKSSPTFQTLTVPRWIVQVSIGVQLESKTALLMGGHGHP